MENKKNDTSDRELRISRLLDAPVGSGMVYLSDQLKASRDANS